MASRYWVGGSGLWNSTDTSHWSATSGGAGGASVPGASDHVTFDNNSGAGAVVNNNYFASFLSLTVTGTAVASVSGHVNVGGGVTCSGSTSLAGLHIVTTANVNLNIQQAVASITIGTGLRSTLLSVISCGAFVLEAYASIKWSPGIQQPFGSVLSVSDLGASIESSTSGTRARLNGAGGIVTFIALSAADIEFVSPPTTWYKGAGCFDTNCLNWLDLPAGGNNFFALDL